MSYPTLASDLELWSGSYDEESASTSPSVETQPFTEGSTAALTGESTLQKHWSRNYEDVQPTRRKSVAWQHTARSDNREKTKVDSQPVDDVANTIRQDGYDLLTQSLARLVNSLSAAVDACCGPSQPPTTKAGDEVHMEEHRSEGQHTGDVATVADPGKTIPEGRALINGPAMLDSGTAGHDEQREERDEQKPPAILPPRNNKMGNTREPVKASDFLDLIASDRRSPLELLEAEIQANAALEAKLLQNEIRNLASEKPANEQLEKDVYVDASKPSAGAVSMPSDGDTQSFAASFVAEPPGDLDDQMEKAQPMDSSPTKPSAGITREHDSAGHQGSLANKGENRTVGAEEPNGEEEILDEEPNHDAPAVEQHASVIGAGGDAPEGPAATDAPHIAGRASLPADVIEKIPDLPRETSSASAATSTSAHSQGAAQSSSSNGNTELVFRYKTPVGLTLTLLFLTAVVIFSVTVGHVMHKDENQEAGGTEALMVLDWSKNESSRALLIPEEDTEREILTLDVN